ncbi:MAG: hypothetical protein N2509_04330 [Treponemataceae bacterium]|nr:hypothetical protein [Treponemataceae bacterium]
MAQSSIDLKQLREYLLERARQSGFVAVRLLEQSRYAHLPEVLEYVEGAPTLLLVALPYGNRLTSPFPPPPGWKVLALQEPPLAGLSGLKGRDSSEEKPLALEKELRRGKALPERRETSGPLKRPRAPQAVPGYIAPFAVRNYYGELVHRLKLLAADLRSRWGGTKGDFRIFCNSHLPERELCLRSGLGWQGRHGLLITPQAGSLVVLGGMGLPWPLPGDTPFPGVLEGDFPACRRCMKRYPPESLPCVAACPTAALAGDGTLRRERCIQWYASGHADPPPDIQTVWGHRLYGCTNCQDACPYHQRDIPGVLTKRGALPAVMDVQRVLSLEEGELASYLRGTTLGMRWLGAAVLKQNAARILTWHERFFCGE